MSLKTYFAFVIVSAVVLITVFPIVAAVRSGKAKTGFAFLGYTAAMQVLSVLSAVFLMWFSLLFRETNVFLGLITWIVLSFLIVHGITHNLMIERIYIYKSDWRTAAYKIERKKNGIFSVSYSITVILSVMSGIMFFGTLVGFGMD